MLQTTIEALVRFEAAHAPRLPAQGLGIRPLHDYISARAYSPGWPPMPHLPGHGTEFRAAFDEEGF